MSSGEERYFQERARIEQGHTKYREKLREEGKLFVRDRLKLLLDPGSEFEEDWLFARSEEPDTPADGVVPGVGRVGGRTVCVMANDYTVKAGSWGEKNVQKIVRIQERAARLRLPLLYLVDAAGGRISEQIKIFPGRLHAGRIFYNEVQLSGVVPQVCILFGPSPAGSADLPALTDRVVDAGSWFEVKRLFARELIVGLARLGGRPVGIVANQPKVKGGVLFVDSADKAARFIWLCNAYNIPLVYLADVSGFMVGSKVERAGIIRHGAKMIFATAQATVPKISVIVRKCYGAGLYAMCGPAFEPDATLALPQGQIAIMGPEPAVNAVYYNKIMELPEGERAAFVQQKREEYARDVDLHKLASEMLVDDIVPGGALRDELVKRLAYAQTKAHEFPQRKNGVYPV